MLRKIKEGKAVFYAPSGKIISKDLSVFYNPVMEYNRSVSIALLNALNLKDMQIALPLAGTGIRGVRFFLELNKGIIESIHFNDYDKEAMRIVNKNLKLNNIKAGYQLSNKDANLFLLESRGFDYIDIDPFGSPNKFLNSAIERISRRGILAVTATDTGALCGTFPDACLRKYWAAPLHNEEMHEVGLRILIRKVQLMGMQFDKALIPVLSYDKDHYMRVFFKAEKGKNKCNSIAKQHGCYKDAGPLWLGKLFDKKIVKKLSMNDKFSMLLKQELDLIGFYEIPRVFKREKIPARKQKKIDDIISKIKKNGFKVSRTHFSEQGIKSDIPYSQLLSILRK